MADTFEFRSVTVRVERQIRKTYRIDALEDGTLSVRAPRAASESDVRTLLEKNWPGIEKMRLKKAEVLDKARVEPITPEEVSALADEALRVLPEKVRFYAAKANVTFGRITVRNQVSKWRRCSSHGNLSFNCIVMLTPEYVQDYLVAHEVCHRKHMDHSAAFWRDVERICPDWRRGRDYLKKNGNSLIERMKAGYRLK